MIWWVGMMKLRFEARRDDLLRWLVLVGFEEVAEEDVGNVTEEISLIRPINVRALGSSSVISRPKEMRLPFWRKLIVGCAGCASCPQLGSVGCEEVAVVTLMLVVLVASGAFALVLSGAINCRILSGMKL